MKVVPDQDLKAALIPKLGAELRWVVKNTPSKETRYPLN